MTKKGEEWVVERDDGKFYGKSSTGKTVWLRTASTPEVYKTRSRLTAESKAAKLGVQKLEIGIGYGMRAVLRSFGELEPEQRRAIDQKQRAEEIDRVRDRARTERGLKLDDGKLDYSLIDEDAEAELVAVLTYGAAKYSRDGWAHVQDAEERYYAAARRHLAAWREGSVMDDESGLHHLGHAICCVHFLLGLWYRQAGPGPVAAVTNAMAGVRAPRTLEARLSLALERARKMREERAKAKSDE